MTTLAIRSKDLQALHNYWQGKCNGRIGPARAEIVPPEIKSQLRRIFIVEIVGTPP